MLDRLPLLYGLILVAETLVLGAIYLIDPPASSDPLSVWLGWGALISMMSLLVYSIARRSRAFRQAAKLSYWLHFHIFLGLQGVMWALFHSSHLLFKEHIAWFNPGTLSLIIVIIVFFSGIFGRYLYSWLPRKIGGEQMAAAEVDRELAELTTPLPESVSALWKDAAPAGGFFAMIQADLATRGALRQLAALPLEPAARDVARRRVLLERKKRALVTTQRFFGWWIVLHRPLAMALYVLCFMHVAISYMFTPSLGR